MTAVKLLPDYEKQTKIKTMIQITIDCVNGAQARKELLDLLTGNGALAVTIDQPIITLENDRKISEPKTEETAEQKPAEENVPVKKRRTKAEIEAANSIDKEPEVMGDEPNDQAETMLQDNKDQVSTVTAQDLQKKAVELGRVGKRELCKAVLLKFGAEAITSLPKPLDPKHYAEVLAELEKL